MKRPGNLLAAQKLVHLLKTMRVRGIAQLLLAALLCYTSPSMAALFAQIDRAQVALGDSLQLTIIATGDEELSEINLSALERDFDILRRSTNSSIKVINGSRTHEKKLVIDLAPLRTGNLRIPSFTAGQQNTRALRVAVGPAPDMNSKGNNVVFEAEVDKTTAYVQSQIILTLRIQRAIELTGMSISELELDGAFVKPLETNEFYRTIEGRNWRVHEVRYAIFPEQSGPLTIPAQVFSSRASTGRSGFFSQNSGRLMRRSSEPLTIEVKPRPAGFTGNTWLPAQQLKIEERWSTPPNALKAGESVTRTITMLGEGIQGAQLPPVLYPAQDGLKFYPDQPEITEQEVSSGLLGARRDITAIVPTTEGSWTLPEVRIPWWDTRTEQMRYALLPAKTLQVAPADPSTTLGSAGVVDATQAAQQIGAGGSSNTLLWQALTAVCALGWLATLVLLWLNRKHSTAASTGVAGGYVENTSERRAFKLLQKACATNDAASARKHLIDWGALAMGTETSPTLQQIAGHFGDSGLNQAMTALDSHLYQSTASPWQGAELANSVERVRQTHKEKQKGTQESDLALYPT
ncbi:MAG: BatD family protein [Halioglobus sp.]